MAKRKKSFQYRKFVLPMALLLFILVGYFYLLDFYSIDFDRTASSTAKGLASVAVADESSVQVVPELDKVDYDRRMDLLANYGTSTASTTASSTIKKPWPPVAVYPKAGAILPFKRVIAYYGNLYSKNMGALGEYPEGEMFQRLDNEVKKWEMADPLTPVQPALHYIVTTAQGSAGADGKYRLRMPSTEIDKVLAMAKKIDAIVFLDIQIGLSNLPAEIPQLEEYLKMPQVHLGIDPEFSMKTGNKPGTVIGTMNASDVNYATNYLAKIVQENNLPPKILVVHRFTGPMLVGYKDIKTLPEVQIVVDMDGWGSPAKKIDTYKGFVASQPIQFTGFKLFYKNDLKQPPHLMMTPSQVLKLQPRPIYIQYQ